MSLRVCRLIGVVCGGVLQSLIRRWTGDETTYAVHGCLIQSLPLMYK